MRLADRDGPDAVTLRKIAGRARRTRHLALQPRPHPRRRHRRDRRAAARRGEAADRPDRVGRLGPAVRRRRHRHRRDPPGRVPRAAAAARSRAPGRRPRSRSRWPRSTEAGFSADRRVRRDQDGVVPRADDRHGAQHGSRAASCSRPTSTSSRRSRSRWCGRSPRTSPTTSTSGLRGRDPDRRAAQQAGCLAPDAYDGAAGRTGTSVAGGHVRPLRVSVHSTSTSVGKGAGEVVVDLDRAGHPVARAAPGRAAAQR